MKKKILISLSYLLVAVLATVATLAAVGLSVGKYFTPKGVSLAGVGITPDVVVPVDEETAAAIYYDQLEPEDDPQIQAALELLEKK